MSGAPVTRAFLGLGSNTGDRLGFLRAAVRGLREIEGIVVGALSPVYETQPVGKTDQADFLNAVAEVRTSLSGESLLRSVKDLEARLGRTATERWGPREIDVDILYLGDCVISAGSLRVPHPEIHRRRFVLVPLADVAPDFPDPLTGRRIADLLAACPGRERILPTGHTIDV